MIPLRRFLVSTLKQLSLSSAFWPIELFLVLELLLLLLLALLVLLLLALLVLLAAKNLFIPSKVT